MDSQLKSEGKKNNLDANRSEMLFQGITARFNEIWRKELWRTDNPKFPGRWIIRRKSVRKPSYASIPEGDKSGLQNENWIKMRRMLRDDEET